MSNTTLIALVEMAAPVRRGTHLLPAWATVLWAMLRAGEARRRPLDIGTS